MPDPSWAPKQEEEAAEPALDLDQVYLKFSDLLQGSFLPHNTKNSVKSKQQQPTAIEQTRHCLGHGINRFEIDAGIAAGAKKLSL